MARHLAQSAERDGGGPGVSRARSDAQCGDVRPQHLAVAAQERIIRAGAGSAVTESAAAPLFEPFLAALEVALAFTHLFLRRLDGYGVIALFIRFRGFRRVRLGRRR